MCLCETHRHVGRQAFAVWMCAVCACSHVWNTPQVRPREDMVLDDQPTMHWMFQNTYWCYYAVLVHENDEWRPTLLSSRQMPGNIALCYIISHATSPQGKTYDHLNYNRSCHVAKQLWITYKSRSRKESLTFTVFNTENPAGRTCSFVGFMLTLGLAFYENAMCTSNKSVLAIL